MFALFFVFGGITSLNDVIIPKLKEIFVLTYAEAMLVQSAFFMAYFVFSIPAARVVLRVGYMRTAALGLATMCAGCLLFMPASSVASFPVFLTALFVLAAGITVVQVVANPLIVLLGKPATAHSRLTFAQAFNSLGTTVFPYVGSVLILGSLATVDASALTGAALDAYRAQETHRIFVTYLGLAIALIVAAALVWRRRNRLPHARPHYGVRWKEGFELLRQRRFAFGAACIFLYVGGEVAIGSIIVSYLMQPDVMGLAQRAAGDHVSFYWGGAMVGRFVGSYVLRIFSPGKVLACVAAGRARACCRSRRLRPGRCRAGRCSRSDSATRSCFRRSSRSRAKGSERARRKARASSRPQSSAALSCRSCSAAPRISRV